jgi:polysaccharide export outer membrane protein
LVILHVNCPKDNLRTMEKWQRDYGVSPQGDLSTFRVPRGLKGSPAQTSRRGLALTLSAGVLLIGLASFLFGQEAQVVPSPGSVVAQPPPAPSTPSPSRSPELLISPDDLLDVYVLDVPQISRQYRVTPSGEIVLPLLAHPMAAAGLSPVQLSSLIAEELRSAGLVTSPYVTVEVKESRLHSVAVGGAVKKPQIYPVFGRTTLLDVLAQAEGLSEDAGNTATISRGEVARRVLAQQQGDQSPASTPVPTVTVDLKRLMETPDPSLNYEVFPGDRVTVQRAGIVYVVGAVNRPGGFPLTDSVEEMTVLKAIALAQDVKGTAVRSKALIIRKSPEAPGGREEIPIDLKKVLAGRAPDAPLQPSDILFVPDSTGKKALRRAAEAAIQVTAGVIIWRR